MSDQNPPESAGTEPTMPLAGEPAIVVPVTHESAAAPARRRRGGTLTAGVAVVVLALLSGGAFAAYRFLFGGGPQPDEVLPASTIAVVSLDLNPSAGQKIAAIETIQKFPALRSRLGIKSTDDVRKFVFEKATRTGSCSRLDYARDVEPWLGQRIALAAVDLGGKDPVPALAVQVSDQKAADAGFARIIKCADPGTDFGYVVGPDYLIASDSKAHAEAILKAGEAHPLAKDTAYSTWVKAAGDQGVLNFYVAKKAAGFLIDQLGSVTGGRFPGGAGADLGGSGGSPADAVTAGLKSFQGLAGTLRFSGGGLELAFAAGGLQQRAGAPVGNALGDLPADTALAFGLGIPKDYGTQLLDSLKGLGGNGQDFVRQAEEQTGLSLPGDLQTLLGNAITLSVGGTPPADLNKLQGLDQVPAGLVLHGDATAARGVLSKLERHLGFRLSDVPIQVEASGSRLVLSPSPAYAEELKGAGGLGSTAAFSEVIPNAGRAVGAFYLDFDSPWRDSLINLIGQSGGTAADQKSTRENTDPLKALGISSWVEGKVTYGLVKLTTD